MVSPGAQQARPGSHAALDARTEIEGRPGTFDESTTVDPDEREASATNVDLKADADRRALLHAISPGPAALRRDAPPRERAPDGPARRASDAPPGPAPGNPGPPAPAPTRNKPTTLPPALPQRRPHAGAPAPDPTPSPTAAAPTPAPPGSSVMDTGSTVTVVDPAALMDTSLDFLSAPAPPPPAPPARPKTPSTPPPTPRARIPSTPPPVPPRSAVPPTGFGDDFNTVAETKAFVAKPIGVEAPPPTRIQAADRPFTPPKVHPVPEVPEPGLVNAARYALQFGRARFQRRGAIKTLHVEIKQDTEALDQVLGALGRTARQRRVDGRVFSAENTAINAAEERIGVLTKEHGDVELRKAEENSRFVDIERERNAKLAEAEKLVEECANELAQLDGQRRSLRDQRKDLERRQKAYLKSAEDNERQAGSAQMGETRADLRRSAEQFRRDAAAMEPERQEVDRKLGALERPISEATAKLDAAKAEFDAAKRSLGDAREGHNHRLAELDAEQKRKAREIASSEGEITRRLVTLGTLVNLNRIEDPAFAELYQRIDRLRGAITARTTEIEKLTAEREAYDRGTLVRGVSTIGGAIVVFIALIAILRAIL